MINSLYYSLPEKIRNEYLDNVEFKAFELEHRNANGIILNSSKEELIAYSGKAEILSGYKSPLYYEAIEDSSSKSTPKVKFDPSILDFEYQYFVYLHNAIEQ